MVTTDDVLNAALRLTSVAHRTPVLRSRLFDEQAGCEVFFKCENFQRTGAFKFRGAYNAISQLSVSEAKRGVFAPSSGNHAQGVALAAQLCGMHACILMPSNAPRAKLEATLSYGAEVKLCDPTEREARTEQLLKERDHILIHPYMNDQVIAGQGSAALELLEEVKHLDCLLVPVSGGGLISGSALAVASSGIKVIGVEPELACDAQRSLRSRRLYRNEHVPKTIADGLRAPSLGPINFEIIQQHVHDILTVSENEILATMNFISSRMKIVVEASAATAAAVLLKSPPFFQNKHIGVILSGGNQ